MRKARGWALLLISSVSIWTFGLPVFAEEWERGGAEPGYRFVDQLAGAETWISSEGKKIEYGDWEEDHFTFFGEGEEAKVTVSQRREGEREEDYILLNPLRGKNRGMRFFKVPSGSQMALSYGILSERKTEELSYVKFRVSIGKRVFRTYRIQNEKGWKTETIPLGMISFLHRPVVVTFEIYSSTEEPILFAFSGEIRS